MLNGEELIDPTLSVNPAVLEGKAHPIQQQSIQHFGIGGECLIFFFCEQRLWHTVKGNLFGVILIKIIVQLDPSFFGNDWVRVWAVFSSVRLIKFGKVKLPSEHAPLVLSWKRCVICPFCVCSFERSRQSAWINTWDTPAPQSESSACSRLRSYGRGDCRCGVLFPDAGRTPILLAYALIISAL